MAEESTQARVISPERATAEVPQRRKVSLVGQFQKLEPPKFKGEEGPEAADDFICGLEKIFGVLGCSPEERVLLAEFSLHRGAEAWWKASRDSAMAAGVGDPWMKFREAFLGKYFPFSFREDKALEFAQLIQGTMSVDEYEGRFATLTKYGPIMDPVSRARKFELGLDPEVRLQVAPFMLTSYEDIYRRAQNVEKALVAVRGKTEAESSRRPQMSGLPPRKKFRSGGTFSYPRPFVPRPPRPPVPARSFSGRGSQGPRPMGPPLCPRCGKYHFGYTCATSEIVCYQCGEPGHMRRNCPRGSTTVGSSMAASSAPRRGGMRPAPTVTASRTSVSRPAETPRLNAVSEADASASRDVIAGTILLQGKLVYALFDTGATHSFVSRECVEKYGWPIEKLEKSLRVVLPSGEGYDLLDVCRECDLVVAGLKYKVDLFVFQISDFEVILGMDWLASSRAQVDCEKRRLLIFAAEEGPCEYIGHGGGGRLMMISATRVHHLLRAGREVFLATVLNKKAGLPRLEEIETVRDFADVFSEELPGLPPERDVEFSIDLVPGTAPISRAPYRMSLAELKELKSQLQELVDKHFCTS